MNKIGLLDRLSNLKLEDANFNLDLVDILIEIVSTMPETPNTVDLALVEIILKTATNYGTGCTRQDIDAIASAEYTQDQITNAIEQMLQMRSLSREYKREADEIRYYPTRH